MSFLDVRQHGFARVAVCVPPVRVADPLANALVHVRFARRVHEEGAQYAVFPELGVAGYTCGDLFFQRPLLDACLEALATIARETAALDLMISVGLPLVVDDALYNCAATIYGGRVVAVHPKSYPPNYREFYELRWFQPARYRAYSARIWVSCGWPALNDCSCGWCGWDSWVRSNASARAWTTAAPAP